MKTIRVTGKGQLKVRPDITRITISLEGLFPEYGEALRRSSEDTECIRDLLTKSGFERTDLKTLNFDIETQYERYNDDGVYKQRLLGYQYRHKVKVEFDSDNERLGNILYALAHCDLQPEFRISYTVKDPEASKNELLAKAIIDAKAKAEVLTKSAGLTLRSIENIDYSWGRLDLEFEPMGNECCMLSSADRYDLDIEPDDIEVSDTVTVVWEIQ